MMANPRRMFLQTAGASLVIPLVGGELAFAQARKGSDPLLAELYRQAKATAEKATRSAVPAGEAVRQVAAVARILSAHGGSIGFDAAVDKALRASIAREGRQAFVARRADVSALAAHLQLEVDVRRLGVPADDYAMRSAALDAVLKNGASHTLIRVAQSFEEQAAKLDAQRGVQLVKQSAADCMSGQWALTMLEFTMIAACGPWAGPFWIETCGIASAMYITYRITLMIMGCI